MKVPSILAALLMLASLLVPTSAAHAASSTDDVEAETDIRFEEPTHDRGGWNGWDWLEECLENGDHRPPPECERPEIFGDILNANDSDDDDSSQ